MLPVLILAGVWVVGATVAVRRARRAPEQAARLTLPP